jgi:hypothetical protein
MAALARALAGRELRAPVPDALIDAAVDAGVAPLLATPVGRLALSGRQRDRLLMVRREAAVSTALLDAALVAAAALADADVEYVAFKGSHVAHALYSAPDLRPRADVDVLVRAAERQRASDALTAAGFTPSVHVRGSLILGQWHFEHRAPGGARIPIDLHWRPFAPLVLATAIDVDAVFRSAESITVGERAIRVPAHAHALALAVLHVAAHHAGSRDLIWLNDIRLLTHALDDTGRETVVRDAREHRYCALAAAGVNAAAELFQDDVLRDLAREVSASASGAERSAALLSRRSPVRDLWLDLRMACWRDRLHLIREHALPSPGYMRAAGEHGWLPWAYTRRAVRGALRRR